MDMPVRLRLKLRKPVKHGAVRVAGMRRSSKSIGQLPHPRKRRPCPIVIGHHYANRIGDSATVKGRLSRGRVKFVQHGKQDGLFFGGMLLHLATKLRKQARKLHQPRVIRTMHFGHFRCELRQPRKQYSQRIVVRTHNEIGQFPKAQTAKVNISARACSIAFCQSCADNIHRNSFGSASLTERQLPAAAVIDLILLTISPTVLCAVNSFMTFSLAGRDPGMLDIDDITS